MSIVDPRARDSVAQQAELFRLAEHRFGLTIAKISKSSGLPETTLRNWRNGAAITAWGLFALGEAGVPDELLSLVSLPLGKAIVSTGTSTNEELCELAADLDYTYANARRPNSEAGVEISHREALSIGEIADRLRAVARRG
jgi:hypothetical protein